VEAFLASLIASLIYVHVVANASTGAVLLSVASTLIFLVLNLLVMTVATVLFMRMMQKVLAARYQEKVPFKSQKGFFTWGVGAVLWAMALPWVYLLIAKPVVGGLMGWALAGKHWFILLVSSPLILIALFAVSFWAARGVKAFVYLATFPAVEK